MIEFLRNKNIDFLALRKAIKKGLFLSNEVAHFLEFLCKAIKKDLHLSIFTL